MVMSLLYVNFFLGMGGGFVDSVQCKGCLDS